MTNMATMPIYGKNLKKSNSPEAIDRWSWNLVCSIVYASTTKVVQIMTWVDLDPFYAKVKFGDICFCMGESENYFFFFGTYGSLRSQSCLKHSTKWVNEVEWASKVKVILWPWSKVTQISKLNVWLLVCILRWANQGLLALLFFHVSWNIKSYFLWKTMKKYLWMSSAAVVNGTLRVNALE